MSGEAKLSITLKGGIQTSNYNSNSFWVENTGGKAIVRLEVDVTNALFPDMVFDPFGVAGDTVAKKLTIDTNGATGVIAPSDSTSYIGTGGKSGFEKIQISFDPNVNGGFQPGEAFGFSVDMDPNSIAGSLKSTLDAGTQPNWDVGGVNGAELIGSLFTVTFTDGTTAQGQLQGVKTTSATNSQGGAQALASQAASAGTVNLMVDGLAPGQAGTYADVPEVVISGPAGQTARIVLAKGFVQPTGNLFEGSYAAQFDEQIASLFASDFPANNAVQFQVVDVVLDGGSQNITSMFDFATVPVSGVVNADRLPLGIVASLIDPTRGDVPIGPVTAPINLRTSNMAPDAKNDSATTAAGTTSTLSVLANDTDGDGDVLRLWSVTQGAHGSVVNNVNGTLTYTPNANFHGTDSFTYTVADGQGGTDTASVAVTVESTSSGMPVLAINTGRSAYTAANGVAYLADQYFSGGKTYKTSASIANTVDDALYQSERFGAFSYAMPVADGTYTVTLMFAETYFGTAGKRVFDVTAEGDLVIDDLDIWSAAGGKNIAYDVPITVEVADGTLNLGFLGVVENAKVNAILVESTTSSGGNGSPMAGDDTATLDEDSAATLPVLANDSDADGDPLTVGSVTQGANGSVVANPDGTLTYTPNANFHGTDSFTYTVADGQGGTDTASVAVTVAPVNDAPVAGDDTASTTAGTAVTIGVLANDSDADGDPLTVGSVTQGANGSVVANPDGTLTYTPNANFHGTDSFTYTVADGQGGTDTASVAVTVAPVNDAPVAGDDTASTTAGTAVTIGVLANDSDADGDPLTVGSVTQGANGSVVANPDGTLTYTPNANFHGTDSFTYTVADGQGGTDTASVAVTVESTSSGTPLVAVNAGGKAYTDVDGVPYLADQYFSGGKTFKTSASIINTDDDTLYQSERYGAFSYAMPVENGIYTVTLNFAEIYFDAAGKRVFDVTAEGDLVIDDLDIWSAAGGKNVAYDVTKTVQVTDGTLNLGFLGVVENPKVSAILVESAPSGPVAPNANDDTASTPVGTAVTIDVLANDSDVNGDPLQIVRTTRPANGTVSVINRGTTDPSDDKIVYTPNDNFTGTDTFSYTISDGNGGNDTATVAVEVQSSDTIAFTTVSLTGIPNKSYTSLQFGPDGRLYASDRLGEVFAFKVQQQVDSSGNITGYAATNVETINLIKSIPNHNDDGTLNAAITNRQITGIAVTGTAENPVLYVGSSDPREGGGSGGGKGDTGLDTNSGIISRLTWNGSSWEKLDLVRGLPRSEENHSTNGLTLSTDPETGHEILLVAQGGHTNAGAPSTNFAYSTEYALSAAILLVDLSVLESGTGAYSVKTDGAHRYVYDIPTVLGPVFGGQDGLNQARLVADGPVTVYSSGWRNPYDVVVTESGKLFTIDNGANKGWGGLPDGEGTAIATNKIPTNDPDGFNSVNNHDHLEYISHRGYYGGHPNPVRANPDGAGLTYTSASGAEVWTQTPGGAWPPVDPMLSFPNDGDFLLPGVEDNALVTWRVSTNGLDEYTASNFGGKMNGNIITAAFDSSIYRVVLDPTTSSATKEAIASGLSGTPLDVIAQGDFDPFPGTIWIAYVAGTADIQALVPTVANGTADDSDGDGYLNEDELANGTNPNSPSSIPPDNDTDLVSDLKDADDDNDVLLDPADHFAIDAANGTGLSVTGNQGFFNPLRNDDPGYGFSGLGFTGWMNNGRTDYLNQYDEDNLIAGGTSGIFSIVQTSSGDARGSLNTQENGFQFGIGNDLTGSRHDAFLVNARMLNVFSPLTTAELAKGQSAGLQIGTGDQDNYIKLAVAANAGKLDILVLREEGGVVVSESFIPASIPIGAQVDLFFEVNPALGTVTPAWQVDGGTLETGAAITLASGSSILSAINGTYQNAGVASAMAVGVIATHGSTNTPFSAQYDHINVYAGSLADQATTTVVLAARGTEPLSFDASDTFIYSDEVSYVELSKLDLDRPLPPGIVKRGALPPGLEKDGRPLPPGLENKSALPPGLDQARDVELPSSAAAKIKAGAEPGTPANGLLEESPSLESFETRVLQLTNELRVQHGKAPLVNDAVLNRAAEDWSRRMAEEDFFAHSTSDQVEGMGYDWQAWGENIAAGHQTPESVVQDWVKSPAHLANLLSDDFKEIGIGYHHAPDDAGTVNYAHYWTQIFATEDIWA